MRDNYKQFIHVNERITLTNGVYRLILISSLNTLCATADMRAAVVPRIGGKWEVREVPTPEPLANQVLIKFMQVGYATQMYITAKAEFQFQ